MVTQGQNYITGKKITLLKMTEKSTVPVLEGALPVMQISQFGNQHLHEACHINELSRGSVLGYEILTNN